MADKSITLQSGILKNLVIPNNQNFISNPGAEVDTTGVTTYSEVQTVTITNATPAVFTNGTNTTGYYNGMPIIFTTSGALPTGLTAGTTYYIIELGTDGASKYRVSASRGGSAINTSSAGSGTHSSRPLVPTALTSSSLTGLTFSRNTSSPLSGAADFKLAQSNSTVVAGQGIYQAFTIDAGYKGQTLSIEVLFNADSNFSAADGITAPNSGGAGDSDLEFWIYDVTNSQLIPVTPQVITANGSNNYSFKGIFQSNYNSSSYRLVLHAAKASSASTGYNFRWDNISISGQPTSIQQNAIAASYTTAAGQSISQNTDTIVDFGTKVFDNTAAVTTGSSWKFTAQVAGFYQVNAMVGWSTLNTGVLYGLRIYKNGSLYRSFVTEGDTYSDLIYDIVQLNPGDYIDIRAYQNAAASVTLEAAANRNYVSIALINSNNQITINSPVAAKAYRGTNQTGINPNNSAVKITLDTIQKDTNGAFNTTDNRYVIPTSGVYSIEGQISLAGTNVLNNIYILQIYKNGSVFAQGNAQYPPASGNVYLSVSALDIEAKPGDYYELYFYGLGNNSASTLTAFSGTDSTRMQVVRIPGSMPVSSGPVAFQAAGGNPASASSGNPIIFPTAVYDTVGGYNASTGRYTVQQAGFYRVHGCISSANSAVGLNIYKNASININVGFTDSNGECSYTGTVQCIPGDIIDLRPGATLDADASSTLLIERI